jgi:hypothetical protein
MAPKIVLLDWSLSTLDGLGSSALDGIRTQFAELNHELGFCTSWLSVWRSSAALFRSLRFRSRFQEVELIQQFFNHFEEPQALCPDPDEEAAPPSYAAAREAVVEVLVRSPGEGTAWDRHRHQLANAVAPGLEATATDRSIERLRWPLAFGLRCGRFHGILAGADPLPLPEPLPPKLLQALQPSAARQGR